MSYLESMTIFNASQASDSSPDNAVLSRIRKVVYLVVVKSIQRPAFRAALDLVVYKLLFKSHAALLVGRQAFDAPVPTVPVVRFRNKRR